MTGREDGRERVRDGEDDAFVRRLRVAYRPAPSTGAARAAFRSGVEARIQRRRRRRWISVAAGLATATAAVALVFTGTAPVGVDPPASDPATSGLSPEETLLLLAAPLAGTDESLPDDYEAIAGLFLGEV